MNSLAQLRPRFLYLLQVLLYLEIWQQQSSSRNLQKPHKYIAESLFINMCQSFDWSHIATLFIRSSGRAVYTLVYSNPLIKIKQKARTFNQNYSEENMCEHTLTNICDSRKSAGKTECLLYLREYLPISCFSPGCCTSCVRLWVYSRKRDPLFSPFAFLYNIYVDNYEWRWKFC